MDAHCLLRPKGRGAALVALLILTASALPEPACGAGSRTTNFVIQAPTQALAVEIGQSAEKWRKELAIEWLGKEMPAWSKPCPITARVGPHLGAGGETSFVFDQGEVFGWNMKVQGSRERVLDSVLPHEITHTIFASHFRQPLPRWADEGACTTVEHPSEVGKQERMLIRFLKTGRGIPFSQLFAIKQYPADVMPLYSQGHSLATFLIERRGKKAFLEFLADGMEHEDWPSAVETHYGHPSLLALQQQWLSWVKQGRPRLTLENGPTAVAAAPAARPAADPSTTVALAAAPAPPAATARSSVYSVRAQPNPQPAPSSPSRESIYDASRGSETLMR